MAEEPSDDGGDRPKFFKSVSGWIAGATGILVAVGGLTAAWHDIVPKHESVDAQAPNTTATDNSNASDDSSATSEESAANDDPWGYTTDDGGTLRYQGGRWIEKDASGTAASYDVESVQNGFTYARDSGAGPDGADVDLRWPTKGGQAQKSTDGEVNWNDAYVVTPEKASDNSS